MYFSLPKPAVLAFLFTSIVYLVVVSFISYPLTTFLKPIPIACLIIGVVQSNLLRSAKILMVLALGFSLVGDIVLTLPIQLVLEFGIGCFFLAHCCYITLFLKSYQYRIAHIIYFSPVLLFSAIFSYIILPHLGTMLVPVIGYFFVLILMVFTAFQVKNQCLVIALGALSFLLSDSILSYNLFVMPELNVRVVVMLSYYFAQLLLTLGLVGIYNNQSLSH